MPGIGQIKMEVNRQVNKFWQFKQVKNAEQTENVLVLSGYIAQESWFGDEITPALFKSELSACIGDITVWVNSPGGDCFAASEIYTSLKEHSGRITVKIDGIAASAASVIAMAGDLVEMSPTAMMMCHNPALLLCGEAAELEKGIEFLNEVKESIINAYALKTGLSRAKISKLMDSETWFNARAAIDYGFCDRMMYAEGELPVLESISFDKAAMVTNTVSAMRKKLKAIPKPDKPGINISDLESRLNLIRR
jgi:ATP-dependent Clp protease protease subunit